MRNTCLNTIYKIAKKDERIVFIGSDLGPGVLEDFKKEMPNRFFMEGVAEQFIIGFAAGLAKEGFMPYVNTIATFLTRRCYEQIVLELCLHNLPVRLVANGGGLVYAPLGPTHQSIEDISILRPLPNMTIVAPCDALEMEKLVHNSLSWKNPIYIRIAAGGEKNITKKNEIFEIGKANLMREPKDNLIISTGITTHIAIDVADELLSKGIKVGVLHMHTVKPLDINFLKDLIPNVKKIFTIEENVLIGGLGSSILEFCSDNLPSHTSKISRMGISDFFCDKYGNQSDLLTYYGLSKEFLLEKILKG